MGIKLDGDFSDMLQTKDAMLVAFAALQCRRLQGVSGVHLRVL